jgi:hypothetical protein
MERLTSQEISTLPKDMVTEIKQHCATEWPADFEMRVYCEDNQYVALRKLMDRGSLPR